MTVIEALITGFVGVIAAFVGFISGFAIGLLYVVFKESRSKKNDLRRSKKNNQNSNSRG